MTAFQLRSENKENTPNEAEVTIETMNVKAKAKASVRMKNRSVDRLLSFDTLDQVSCRFVNKISELLKLSLHIIAFYRDARTLRNYYPLIQSALVLFALSDATATSVQSLNTTKNGFLSRLCLLHL